MGLHVKISMITPPIPREHGAYVILACSWLLGLLGSPRIEPLPSLLSLVAVFSLFLMQEPLRLLQVARRTGRNGASRPGMIRWALATGSLAVIAGTPVVLARPEILWLLLPASAVMVAYGLLVARRAPMNRLSLAGFIGLALTAPGARIAAAGGFPAGELLALWLLAACFFCGSSFCVNIRLKGDKAVAPAIRFHLAAMGVTFALVALGLAPPIALAAMLPAIAKLVWIIRDIPRYRAMPLKRIGIQESLVAILFVILYNWN
jgi:hypothetical protein